MAIAKWAGGIVILIAFIIAGKVQATDITNSSQVSNQASIGIEHLYD